MGLDATVRTWAAMLFLSLAAIGAAKAAPPPDVDLALVLAVDVSRSMDMDELKLQRDGYAAAFRHPDVLAAIADGATGRIAVTYFEWAGPDFHLVVAPWTVIASRDDAEALAAKIAAAPFVHASGTSISSGLFFAAGQLDASGVSPARRDVDVSGDGPNNVGLAVDATRDWLVRRGVTINGLPIMVKPWSGNDRYDIPNLDVYYENCVIGGPGAFMITVTDPASFEIAIRRKLVLEISGLPPHLMPAAAGDQPSAIDCQIGEKTRWNRNPDAH